MKSAKRLENYYFAITWYWGRKERGRERDMMKDNVETVPRHSNAHARAFLNAQPSAVMWSCSDIFSCKYPAGQTFKLSINNGKFYSYGMDERVQCAIRRAGLIALLWRSGLLVRETDATWRWYSRLSRC